jgi:hypothetical protein
MIKETMSWEKIVFDAVADFLEKGQPVSVDGVIMITPERYEKNTYLLVKENGEMRIFKILCIDKEKELVVVAVKDKETGELKHNEIYSLGSSTLFQLPFDITEDMGDFLRYTLDKMDMEGSDYDSTDCKEYLISVCDGKMPTLSSVLLNKK